MEINDKYLRAFLASTFEVFNGSKTGAAIPHLDKEALYELEFPFAPLEEQQRIVGILDEAFEGIAIAKANAEKNLQNARALFESHLNTIFTRHGEGWIKKPLGELATFRNGVNFTKSSRGESVKIIGVKNFQQAFWAPLEGLESVTTDGVLPDLDILKENDLLFVRSNGNIELIGRSLLVGKITNKISHSGFTIRARLNNEGVVARYLCRFVKSSKVRLEMVNSGIGTNIKSLNQTTLSALIISLPSIAEQMRIVDQLDDIDADIQHLESIYQSKLAALEELKKSLLHQAFTGNL